MRKVEELSNNMRKSFNFAVSIAAIFILFTGIYGQNRFEGYSVVVDANIEGNCPVWYLPSANNGNAIDVFLAGTNQRAPAAGLTACDGSSVREGNKIFANGDGRWCFTGAEEMYEIKLRNASNFLWY